MAMVTSDGAEEFVRFVKDEFYAKRPTDGRSIDQLVFATNPSEGACVYVTTPQDDVQDRGFDGLPSLVHL